MNRLSSVLTSIALAVLLGCASHPTKVDCERKLRPINAPAPAVHPEEAQHEG